MRIERKVDRSVNRWLELLARRRTPGAALSSETSGHLLLTAGSADRSDSESDSGDRFVESAKPLSSAELPRTPLVLTSLSPAPFVPETSRNVVLVEPVKPDERRRWPWFFHKRAAPVDPRRAHVFRALPRRRSLLAGEPTDAAPTMRRSVHFKTSQLSALGRLFVWCFQISAFLLANWSDRIFRSEHANGKSRLQRSAERLRYAFERMGGTAIKIGQQAAMRLDILPPEYCNELSKMLDRVPAFPSEEAVSAIEQATGKPIHETFAAFDPKPIGSASVSCVYKALRLDGRTVAVKVRRPGIGPLFMADCRALELLLAFLEVFALLRPGVTRNVVIEFRNMLVDELDFVKEARNAELFRRRTKKCGLHYVTAPKIHFDCSSESVLVSDFVDGVWLSEVLSAVERKDTAVLSLFERLDIDPKRIARRLLDVNFFTTAESILFHADPHPANIVVYPGSKLVFIDFGACGAYTEKERVSWRRLFDAQAREDVGEMVQCVIAILEPLPPIDIEEFAKKLETVFWQDLYAFRSRHAKWWERTSAHIWISFLSLTREYKIPMNLNTLRMIRSTLLYDTIAARLDHEIDAYALYRRYLQKAGLRAQKRVFKSVDRTLLEGPPPPFWLRVEQFTRFTEKAIYIAQRLLDDPPYKLSTQLAKAAYALQLVVKTAVSVAFSGAVLLAFNFTRRALLGIRSTDRPHTLAEALRALSVNPVFWCAVIAVVVVNARKLNFRLLDREPDGSRTR